MYDVSQPAIRRVAVAETQAESSDLALIGESDLAVATRAGVERFSVAADGSLARTSVDGDEIASIVACNGRDLAGVTPGGITVWDAATRIAVARVLLPSPPAALAWHGDTLLAAVMGVGVHIYDISGAHDPIVVPEDARDLAIDGDTLFVAAGAHGLVTYDLSAATPKLLGRSGDGAIDFATIAVSGSRAFVTEQPDRIHVFDLTSGVPVLTATFEEPGQAIAASGMRLFVSGMLFDAFGVAGNTGTPLRLFDATDPSVPRLAGEFRDFAGPLSGAATDGTLAYVSDRPFFRVIDVSTTTAPREIASLQVDGSGDRVKVKGNRAIVYGRGDVQLIDISNPYAPRVIKVFHSSGGPPSGAAFARNTIVEANTYSGFHVVDFDNFAEPLQIGGLKGHYSDAAAEGDTAWIMYMGSMLVTVDLSDPHNARIANTTVVGGIRTEIVPATARHPELLLVLSADGVHLLSIANSLNPIQTSFVPASSVAVNADGDIAWLASAGLVESLDLTNPAVLQPAAMHPVAPMDIAASGGKVVIADRYSLRVYGPNTPPPPPPRRRPSGR